MDPLAQAQMLAAAPAGDTANVTMNWALFSGIYNAIDTPLIGGVDIMLGAITGQLAPAMKAMLTVYVMWVAYQAIFGSQEQPLGLLIRTLVRCAAVVMLVSNAGNFNQWFGSPLLTTIPNDFGQLLNGAFGGGGGPVNGGAQFDAIWNKSFTGGLSVYNNLPGLSLKGALLTIPVFMFWVAALFFIGVGFLTFLASHVLMALVVAVGPVFVACLLFPASRSFFSGWLSTAVSTLVAQLLIVALVTLMITIENNELGRLAAAPAGVNEIGQIGSLLGVVALLGIGALLARQIPSVAVGIAGGAYHQLNAYTAAAGVAAAAAARGLGAAGRTVAGSASAPARGGGGGLSPMAGRSLSGP